MGMNDPCPYAERNKGCQRCAPTCHAVNPPTKGFGRRQCTRTRQWPGCPRYNEAWKRGVTPFRTDTIVLAEEMSGPQPKGGIGGVTMSKGIPLEPSTPSVEVEVPCSFLVYKESSCKTCGGYVCNAAGDRRIMEGMLTICMAEPLECAIYQSKIDD